MPYRPASNTLVACIWMPRFEIQVERSRDPALAGKPLAVLMEGAQSRVHSCSREAEEAGIKRGMTLREAMATAPQAIFRVMHSPLYQDLFSQAVGALERVSPVLEISAPGCAFVGLEGLLAASSLDGLLSRHAGMRPAGGAGIYRLPLGLMLALEGSIRPPFAACTGIALGKFGAWAVARSRDRWSTDTPGVLLSPTRKSCWVGEDRQEDFLKPLPIQILPVSAEMRRRLWMFGIRTLGQLAALPLSSVIAQFGKEGRRAWFLSHGQDDEPICPRLVETEVVETLQFSEPEVALEAMVAAARQLLERALRRREQRGRGVRQVRLAAGLESGRTWSQVITFRQPGSLLDRLFPPVRYRLERDHPHEAVETLSLALVASSSMPGVQGSLFQEPQQERRSRLMESLRQLRIQMGSVPVARIVEVEPWSRIPERRYHLLDYEP
ncbi:MAG TPA: hypothetical protein VFJ58_20100 [Armatimonadota bacterium]|nr:hypothetical protein [Armatimonadota bacterium]